MCEEGASGGGTACEHGRGHGSSEGENYAEQQAVSGRDGAALLWMLWHARCMLTRQKQNQQYEVVFVLHPLLLHQWLLLARDSIMLSAAPGGQLLQPMYVLQRVLVLICTLSSCNAFETDIMFWRAVQQSHKKASKSCIVLVNIVYGAVH